MQTIKTTRYGALKYIKRILEKEGFHVIQVGNKNEIYLRCLHIFNGRTGKNCVGFLYCSLTGAFYTTNMTGWYRKNILRLIPDELEVKCTLREFHAAKYNGQDFNGIYER